jgi:hypothetical protein
MFSVLGLVSRPHSRSSCVRTINQIGGASDENSELMALALHSTLFFPLSITYSTLVF